jgi:hypothetical protein
MMMLPDRIQRITTSKVTHSLFAFSHTIPSAGHSTDSVLFTGAWSFATDNINNLSICLDRAQSDPYAPPSKIVLRIDNTFPRELWSTRTRQVYNQRSFQIPPVLRNRWPYY